MSYLSALRFVTGASVAQGWLSVCLLTLAGFEATLFVLQEGSQKFWELWDLYNIHGFNLDGVYLQAAVRQVGKVGSLRWPRCR